MMKKGIKPDERVFPITYSAARVILRKAGSIVIGSDADIAIWDPAREVTITNKILYHNVDYTPHEGMKVKGWPETVLSRGNVIVEDGDFVGRPGRGLFLKCDRPGDALSRGTEM